MSTMKKAGGTTGDWGMNWKATETAKKEYHENICNEIIEFQRTGRYDLMYMKIIEFQRTGRYDLMYMKTKN